MRTEFVQVNLNVDVKLDNIVDKIPKRLALFLTSQLHKKYEDIKKALEAAGKEILTLQTRHTPKEGQILGCNIEDYEVRGEFDAFLYIGDGEFHPKALMYNNSKPVFVYNVLNEEFYEMDREETDKLVKMRKGALSTFYMKKNIGVLVTGKSGQNMIHKALKFYYKDKNFFIFVDNTFNYSVLNDFNFIDCWINTACPRIAYEDAKKLDKPIINFEEIPDLGFCVDPELIPIVPGKK